MKVGLNPAAQKILIIDDNPLNKSILEDVLKAGGYDIRCASSGEEGLRIVDEWQPSVVLLDLVMPGMDGLKTCAELRKKDLPIRPSILIVSIKGDKKTIVDCLMNGADDFIAKPVNDAELIARVRAQIRINEFYREVEENQKALETILEISNALSATLDSSEVLDIIVKKVAEVTKAVRCSIVLIVREDEGYVMASQEDPTVRELKLDLTKYPEIKHVMNTKSELILEDAVNHPLMSSVRKNINMLDGMSILIVPIVFNDEVLGTLFLRSRTQEKGFPKKRIDFCKIVANSSFHALKNARLFEKVLKEKEYLKEMAVKDQLTSLYNHNFFYSRLEDEFGRAARYDTPLGLIMLDIDNFKNVNDTYGHRTGDLVLKEVAAVVKKAVRKSDLVARYGGEEFAVILPHTDLKGAMEEAERLRRIIEAHSYAGLSGRITVSVGVAAHPQKGIANSGDLVTFADDALYKAKWGGKNCVKNSESIG